MSASINYIRLKSIMVESNSKFSFNLKKQSLGHKLNTLNPSEWIVIELQLLLVAFKWSNVFFNRIDPFN
jgi:hypothetical protein